MALPRAAGAASAGFVFLRLTRRRTAVLRTHPLPAPARPQRPRRTRRAQRSKSRGHTRAHAGARTQAGARTARSGARGRAGRRGERAGGTTPPPAADFASPRTGKESCAGRGLPGPGPRRPGPSARLGGSGGKASDCLTYEGPRGSSTWTPSGAHLGPSQQLGLSARSLLRKRRPGRRRGERGEAERGAEGRRRPPPGRRRGASWSGRASRARGPAGSHARRRRGGGGVAWRPRMCSAAHVMFSRPCCCQLPLLADVEGRRRQRLRRRPSFETGSRRSRHAGRGKAAGCLTVSQSGRDARYASPWVCGECGCARAAR